MAKKPCNCGKIPRYDKNGLINDEVGPAEVEQPEENKDKPESPSKN